MSDGRKRLSGYQYKKRRLEKENEEKKVKFSLDKYLQTTSKDRTVGDTGGEVPDTSLQSLISENVPTTSSIQTEYNLTVPNYDVTTLHSDTNTEIDGKQSLPVNIVDYNVETTPVNDNDDELLYICGDSTPDTATVTDIVPDSDPANWPENLTDFLRTTLIKRGPPKQVTASENCPKDESNRRFTNNHYTYTLCNGESVQRKWLVYSKSKNVVFCFCCKLFSNVKTSLSTKGYNNWRHISETLTSHSSSPSHIESHRKWIEFSVRLKSGNTIDSNTQRILNSETQHWKNVLERLISIIQFLAQQCLPLRGNTDALYKPDNGNFLKLVELIGKFDSVLSEHIKRTIRGDNKQHHYLGKNIQNELIEIIQTQINNKVLDLLRSAKYYSIILDCTPDISGIEQMTIIVRFVRVETTEPAHEVTVTVSEHFLGFVPVVDTTGLGLTEVLLKMLGDMGIPIEDMRGQGYDNGSNMKGKHIGMQKRILDINPRAFYVPCTSHSLNLVVKDAAMASQFAVSFFCLIKRVNDFFSASTQRWHILMNHMSSITLKPLCPTRWESRIDAVKPFRYHVGEVYDALVEIHESNSDKMVAHEAGCLANLLCDFTFLCSVVIWYDVLLHINVVSKTLQNISADISSAVEMLEKTHTYFKSIRNDLKFQGYLVDAKELASQLQMENPRIGGTLGVRKRKKKQQFQYEGEDEVIENPETQYKVEFFFKTVDIVTTALNERFEQIEIHSDCFDILYDINQVKDMPMELLSEKCTKLSSVLTHGQSKDVDTTHFIDELKVLSTLLKPKTSPLEALKFILQHDFAPNTCVALRILLTLPVTVASGERSFSKLKLIKTYLRSTMSQTRLTGLATISIEHQLAESLDFNQIVKEFASAKARRVSFI